MPRAARIDYPGAPHHIIVRGIERRRLFRDEYDYKEFLIRLERYLTKMQVNCYAWVLMPNHFHLLLIPQEKSIRQFMQSLLTCYAIYFNRRHGRVGRLYQNRYKSILCEHDEYFLELVRYIHLNPLRAGLVKHIKELDRYSWCGHSVLIGNHFHEWQNTNEVLQMFGEDLNNAREKYYQFLSQGLKEESRLELEGGGLVRSTGGIWKVMAAKHHGERLCGDERILGDSDFVKRALQYADEKEAQKDLLNEAGIDADYVINKAAQIAGITQDKLRTRSKGGNVSLARAIACKWLVIDLQLPTTVVAEKLNISLSTVNAAVERGYLRGDTFHIAR